MGPVQPAPSLPVTYPAHEDSGRLPLDREQELIAETHAWLVDRSEENRAYELYLEHWGDWENPWEESEEHA